MTSGPSISLSVSASRNDGFHHSPLPGYCGCLDRYFLAGHRAAFFPHLSAAGPPLPIATLADNSDDVMGIYDIPQVEKDRNLPGLKVLRDLQEHWNLEAE